MFSTLQQANGMCRSYSFLFWFWSFKSRSALPHAIFVWQEEIRWRYWGAVRAMSWSKLQFLRISCENQSPVMKPVSSLVESLFRLVSELNSVVSQSLTTVRSAICQKSSLASVVCTHKYVCTFIKPCIVNNTYRASLFADYSAMRRVTASGF